MKKNKKFAGIFMGGILLATCTFSAMADTGLDHGYMTIHTQMNKNDFGFLDKEYHGWAGLSLNGSNPGGGGNGGGGSGSIDPLAPWIIEDDGLRAQVLAIVTSENGEDPTTYQLIGQDALDFDESDVATYGTPLDLFAVTTLEGMQYSALTNLDTADLYSLTDGRGWENIEEISGAFRIDGPQNFAIEFSSLTTISGYATIGNTASMDLDFPLLTESGDLVIDTNDALDVNFDALTNIGQSNTSIGFYYNTGGLTASFDNFSGVGQTEIVMNNNAGGDIDFNSLVQASSINAWNNTGQFTADFTQPNLTINEITLGGGSTTGEQTYTFSDGLQAQRIAHNNSGANFIYGENTIASESFQINGGSIGAGSDFDGLITIGALSVGGGSVITHPITFSGLETLSSLSLNNATMESLSIANLDYIYNDLTIGGGQIENLSFPSLETINGSLNMNNASSATVEFPNLSTVNGMVNFTTQNYPHSITTLNLDSLETVGNSFNFMSGELPTLSLPSLTSVQSLSIQNGPTTSVNVPNLVNLPSLTLSMNPGFGTTASFASLETLGNATINGTASWSAPNLTTITQGVAISSAVSLNIPNLATYAGAPFINYTAGSGNYIFNT